jgi:pSer/pThr/pTyr-binding forkhead associated (FHA) protein
LSRSHLSLTFIDEEFVCHDLDSSNGVYLNGVRIHSATLRDGDQLQLGAIVLVYREGR